MELKRLRGLSPLTARQLFTSMVAPVVDYASNVWMHECNWKAAPAINRVQRIGAQAIVGTFSTVATRIAEAEADIATAQDRFWKRDEEWDRRFPFSFEVMRRRLQARRANESARKAAEPDQPKSVVDSHRRSQSPRSAASSPGVKHCSGPIAAASLSTIITAAIAIRQAT